MPATDFLLLHQSTRLHHLLHLHSPKHPPESINRAGLLTPSLALFHSAHNPPKHRPCTFSLRSQLLPSLLQRTSSKTLTSVASWTCAPPSATPAAIPSCSSTPPNSLSQPSA
ncbi:hypothetical protein EUGRSUZ_E02995 [Eucalyptus grandis]|uniref:Uncharacterized protein n=2 Tax=Eucalyptus grandis TaxID=71139 RepID=A0ACC3L0N7_EUCGR|nr:hypothetical protein EUGRSUZ_E02995 [Eucalyptus grandis]